MVSKKTEYALRTLVELSMDRKGGIVNVKDIARKQSIPASFLSQIMRTLKGAGMVTSVRGPQGGYQLARKPEEIFVADVLKLTEDHGFFSDAALGLTGSSAKGDEIGDVLVEYWEVLAALVEVRLMKTSVRDLCDRVKNLKAQSVLDYVI